MLRATVDTKNWTAAEDHQNMMDQLGIKALRPGPSGNESAPNHANYDEATANPYPNLPDVLTLKNGKKVTTPAMWWNQRRPEIVEDFEREVLGRVPKNVPEGDLGSHQDGRSASRLACGHRQTTARARGQFLLSRYQGRHSDDPGGPGRRQGSRAGDDDVRRTHAFPRSRFRRRYFPAAARRARRLPADAHRLRLRRMPIRPRRSN